MIILNYIEKIKLMFYGINDYFELCRNNLNWCFMESMTILNYIEKNKLMFYAITDYF